MKRLWHPWNKWECYYAGFFNAKPPDGVSVDDAIMAYSDFLSDLDWFDYATKKVFEHWSISCEHFLTNRSINRVAWIGQSSMCHETGISSEFRSGFKFLSNTRQNNANKLAGKNLFQWLQEHKC